MNFTIGSDPEFFVVKTNTNELVPSYTVLGGDKDHQLPMKCGSTYQCDNVLAELNIKPADNAEAFKNNTREAYAELNDILSEYKCSLSPGKVTAKIPINWLKDKRAMVFGCEPDYDCWFHDNIVGIDPTTIGKLRTAGGHIHIGIEEVDILAFARTLDVYLGIGLMVQGRQNVRRTLYGQAGRFRTKPYGLEYRVPDNQWVTSDALFSIIPLIEQAIRTPDGVEQYVNMHKHGFDRIRHCINTCDKDTGLELLAYMGVDI